MNIVTTGWLSSLPYAFAVVGMIITSYFSDRKLVRKAFIWPYLLVGAIAFYTSYLAGANHFWLSFILLTIAGVSMYSCYGPFFAMLSEILPANVLGGALAFINSFGALGAFGGSYLVGYLNAVTGNFNASYIFMAASLLISSFLTFIAVEDTKLIIRRSMLRGNFEN
jgi:MFS family permease